MSVVPQEAMCDGCRWFCPNGEDEHGDANVGECQFLPPTVINSNGSPWTVYPVVLRQAGCSKWEPVEP